MSETPATTAEPAPIVRPVRHGSAGGRIVSLLLAIVLTPLGVGVLASGGEIVLRVATRGTAFDLGGVAYGILGIILLLMVVQTGRASSLGLWVVGVLLTALGILALVSTQAGTAVADAFRGWSTGLALGLGYWLFCGFVLVLGIVFLAIAVVSMVSRRATPRSTGARLVWRIVSIVVGLVVAPAAGTLLAAGSRLSVTESLGLGRDVGVGAVLLIVAAALVYTLVVLTGTASSAGLLLVGALQLIGGLIAFLLPGLVLGSANGEQPTGLVYLACFGVIALFGAMLVATGSVARVNRRRLARRTGGDSPAAAV